MFRMNSDTGQLRPVVGTGCLVVAVLATLAELFGAPDPVAMPTAPAWLTVAAASAAGLLLLTAGTQRWRLTATGLAALCMAAGSVLAIPHTVLIVVVWTAELFTNGDGSFEIAPAWAATVTHLTTMLAVCAVAVWLIAQLRRLRGRCPRCGRATAAAKPIGTQGLRRLRWLTVLAVAGAVPYAALKLAWSLGSRIGLVGDAFRDVSFTSPGFGDTVLLSGVSVIVCIVMGMRVRRPIVRSAAAGIGGIGSLMLLPVGVAAFGMLTVNAIQGGHIDDTAIAPWAYIVVYTCFLVWGAALAMLTWTYWRATRPECRDHRVSGADPSPLRTLRESR